MSGQDFWSLAAATVRPQTRIRGGIKHRHSKGVASETTLELSPSQLNAIKIEPVGSYLFPVDEQAVGNIDFDDDLSVQVFPPYQGNIIKALVELGDEVQKDQPLYTIDSPDLIQAESTLIGAAATFELTSKELDRAKEPQWNKRRLRTRVGTGHFGSTNS